MDERHSGTFLDYRGDIAAWRCPACGAFAYLHHRPRNTPYDALPKEVPTLASRDITKCRILHEYPLLARVAFNIRAGRIPYVSRGGLATDSTTGEEPVVENPTKEEEIFDYAIWEGLDDLVKLPEGGNYG